jgi:hypothetical protein
MEEKRESSERKVENSPLDKNKSNNNTTTNNINDESSKSLTYPEIVVVLSFISERRFSASSGLSTLYLTKMPSSGTYI